MTPHRPSAPPWRGELSRCPCVTEGVSYDPPTNRAISIKKTAPAGAVLLLSQKFFHRVDAGLDVLKFMQNIIYIREISLGDPQQIIAGHAEELRQSDDRIGVGIRLSRFIVGEGLLVDPHGIRYVDLPEIPVLAKFPDSIHTKIFLHIDNFTIIFLKIVDIGIYSCYNAFVGNFSTKEIL